MGKTFSESWHRVGALRAQLRPQVRVRRQYFRGERWYLLEDPYNNRFFRLRPAAYAFVLRLGPTRTVAEAWQTVLEERPEDAPGQQDVVELLAQLYASNLLHADVPADTAALFQRYQKRVKREATAKIVGAMFARFPLFDPDEFLDRLKPVSDRVFSRWGALVWLLVVGLGLASLAGSAGELMAQTRRVLEPSNLPWLLAVTVLLKALHEFGHMALCKKYGGSVHRAGILLMIFTPMPFADTSSAWGFRERRKRVMVGLGGMIVEIFLAGLAAIVWARSGDGLGRDLAFNAMLIGSVSTLLFNLNPLLRFDGYFILSDLCSIPNLYQRSTAYLRYLCERYLFGLRREVSPANDRGEAWVFGFYGVFGGIYRFVLFGSILFFVWDRFLLLGVLMGLICIVAWIVMPIGKLINYLAGSPKLHLQRARAVGATLGCLAIAVVLTRFTPLPQSVRAPGVLEAERYSQLVSGTGGRVAELVATPGSLVAAGAALLRLEDPELVSSLKELEAQIEEGQARLRKALAEDPTSQPILRGYLEALGERLAEMRTRQNALVVRAPHAGWWISPEIEGALGAWVARGSVLGEIVDSAAFEFRVQVPADRIAQIVSAIEGPAAVRLDGQPWSRLEVTSRTLVAASPERKEATRGAPERDSEAAPAFEFRGRIAPEEGVAMLHGLAGQVRFSLPPESLWRKAQRAWQVFFEKRGPGA